MVVDHRSGDRLDNRRQNLRVASRPQNSQNAIKPRRGSRTGKAPTSTFKGVHRRPSGQWTASIRVDGKLRILGTFQDETEAALVYDAAAREVFGAFACVNFPQGAERPAQATLASAPAQP